MTYLAFPHKVMYDFFTEAQLTSVEREAMHGAEEDSLVSWRGELMFVANVYPLELREVEQ